MRQNLRAKLRAKSNFPLEKQFSIVLKTQKRTDLSQPQKSKELNKRFAEDNYVENIDSVVPGVAFDRQGGRLGHGKGYYDRFLELTNAFRLGLTFNRQLLETVPTELHDVPMNAILSELREIMDQRSRIRWSFG